MQRIYRWYHLTCGGISETQFLVRLGKIGCQGAQLFEAAYRLLVVAIAAQRSTLDIQSIVIFGVLFEECLGLFPGKLKVPVVKRSQCMF